MPSTALDEARAELQGALDAWDFAPCYPAGYSGDKKVITAQGYPSDLISNIRTANNGMWPLPILAIYTMKSPEAFRSLGEVDGPGAVQGTIRYARAVHPSLCVDCWADLQTGAEKMVEQLAAQVQLCVFVNSHSLATYRYLTCEASHLMYSDAAQAWHIAVTVSGQMKVSYDL